MQKKSYRFNTFFNVLVILTIFPNISLMAIITLVEVRVHVST